jgi:hypothetical protein
MGPARFCAGGAQQCAPLPRSFVGIYQLGIEVVWGARFSEGQQIEVFADLD